MIPEERILKLINQEKAAEGRERVETLTKSLWLL